MPGINFPEFNEKTTWAHLGVTRDGRWSLRAPASSTRICFIDGSKILNRSALISVLLILAIALVGIRTQRLWRKVPWNLPQVEIEKGVFSPDEPKGAARRPPSVSTKNIIEKDLFDPDRGAVRGEGGSAAFQRLREFTLVGTAIVGNDRYAILEDPSASRSLVEKAGPNPRRQLRLKLGEILDGFILSEIYAKGVVFRKGSSRIEISLASPATLPPPAAVPVPR